MTFLDACLYLDSFTNYELQLDRATAAAFSLERFSRLLEALGSPQQNFQALHVAGTKGKGSTCTFAAHIIKEAGYRVGLYTSPHLLEIRERIRVLDPQADRSSPSLLFSDCISEEDFSESVQKIKLILDGVPAAGFGPPTYFEILTAVAFLHFSQKQVDFVVLETGLGGRLDATNVVEALACGITAMGLEHTQILGATLTAIATEKAAIIKNASPVVVAPQTAEVMAVIEQRCQQQKAPMLVLGKDILWQSQGMADEVQKFSVRTIQKEYALTMKIFGTHQCENVAQAIALVEMLPRVGGQLNNEIVQRALARLRLPGRFEIVRRHPLVIVDVAHTPEAMQRVGETLRQNFPEQKVITILGLSRDKDQRRMIEPLGSFTEELILTKADHPRAATFDLAELQRLFPGRPMTQTENINEAVVLALSKARGEKVILITGSFFVVAQAWRRLQI